MQKREITELGNPILRRRATEVENISDEEFQQLIDDMILTAIEASGVGIAAPQVSEALRLFIMIGTPSSRYPDAEQPETKVIINPKIVSVSDEMEKDWEGCLSIPGIRGLVPRHKCIEVTYKNRNGRLVKASFSDFEARVFQHEYDHLEGTVFLDRMESPKEIITEKEYFRLISNEKSQESDLDESAERTD